MEYPGTNGERGGGGVTRWPPRRALEFGAGAALPSMILLREGAGTVVMTDRITNEETFEALEMSSEKNCRRWDISEEERERRAVVRAHTWGEDAEKLLEAGGRDEEDANSDGGGRFDLLVASDCIYNPTYHEALLRSASAVIDESEGLFVVGYSFHGNVPPERVTQFFDLAESSDDEHYGGFETVSEFKKEYDGQRGLGSSDSDRGAVYVRVMARRGSKYCQIR
uniref:Calmodulin-lysine N-methyltransferase n=1 Tax=Odontella aurita TaxID=265563 RepID=A0A7S4IZL9_9STRA|mmetsp:Transcript_34149/g.102155  ORF Transcript_34149/g.102155 Transcript_34149/m.102155 type:complete len:224 (+) Transcript_34149:3343-4014(+)